MANTINFSDKFRKTNDSFTVILCDNGFLLELGGLDPMGDWVEKKFLISTLSDLNSSIEQIVKLPRRG